MIARFPRKLAHRSTRGFSLIELLVAVTIGLVVTLAVFGVLAAHEGRKRTSMSANDTGQSGAFAIYTLDRAIRSAGSGFAEGWARVGGCRLNATLPANPAPETWPRTANLPAPFAAVPQTVRLAPVVIFQGASASGSDVVMVMSGAAGYSESPTTVQPGSVGATEFRVPNTIGYTANDLVMLVGSGECLLTQVATTKVACAADPTALAPPLNCGQQVPLGGSYHNSSSPVLATLATGDAYAIQIGNIATNRPQFQLFGVGDNTTLFSQDLLLLNGNNNSLPLAEGVRELHAVYGIDTDNDGRLDAWQPPTGLWSGATLMDGTSTSNARLRQIVAIRIGMIMRSSLVERELPTGVSGVTTPVAPASIALFSDLPAAARVNVDLTRATENRNQRHSPVELTIPVRNLLLRP